MKPYCLVLSLGLLCFFLFPFAAGDTKEEAIKKDRQKYKGTWQVVSLEIGGNKAPEEDAQKITVINEENGKWTLLSEGKVIARGTSTIDPTKKPKGIDLKCTEGSIQGETLLGIYEVGDTTRKVCLAELKKGRPSEFSSPSGSEQILATFKRLKK
jgi:uncharacterized protein (TIGR03067 family)